MIFPSRPRRMISRSISTSEKVNSVSVPARLLFTWLILHCDDDGRMQGSPATVKAMVLPMVECTAKEVEGWLGEQAKAGLINWYNIKGEKYLQVKKWDTYQSFHGCKRIKSELPPPPTKTRHTSIGVNIHHGGCKHTPDPPHNVIKGNVKQVNLIKEENGLNKNPDPEAGGNFNQPEPIKDIFKNHPLVKRAAGGTQNTP